jgi:hypothetical protein
MIQTNKVRCSFVIDLRELLKEYCGSIEVNRIGRLTDGAAQQ